MLEIKEAADKAGKGITDNMGAKASVDALGSALASASGSLDKFKARDTSSPRHAKNQIGSGPGFGTIAAVKRSSTSRRVMRSTPRRISARSRATCRAA